MNSFLGRFPVRHRKAFWVYETAATERKLALRRAGPPLNAERTTPNSPSKLKELTETQRPDCKFREC
jgi:hypothetical protein